METSYHELKKIIKNHEAIAFRLYSEQENSQPWLASFGYMTTEFSGFNYIDAQYPSLADESEAINNLFGSLAENTPYPYGIKYFSDKITKALYYATGDNMHNIYKYENASLFKRECPGRFKGQARYRHVMLRMVYPLNVINHHHLDIVIENISLKEWISSNEKHGTLEELNNDLWLWTVDNAEIDKINESLGKAGALISWKPLDIKKSTRKLP
ncbi:hypothetical protein JHU04_004283 [Brenneria sp. 4F2]|nr:hypothetical protein [Brenneria bubanii]